MFKKMNFSSPMGIALMAAGVILAISPDARRTIRRLVVKGTAGMMDVVEQVGGVTAGVMKKPTVTWKSSAQVDLPAQDEHDSMTDSITDNSGETVDDTH